MFTALASSPLSFMTTGFFGKITFFFLEKLMNFLANNGLILLNIGVDHLQTAIEKDNFDEAIEEALKVVRNTKGKITKERAHEIDQPVIDAFRKFISLV